MTCIVALKDDSHICIAGDSAALYSSDYSIRIRKDSKVFNNNKFLIGFTTSFRMGQVLRYKFKPPKNTRNDIMEYMVADFIEEVRKVFVDTGFTNGTFIVIYRGEIFTIENDFQVSHCVDPYAAVGCGAQYALGALYMMEGRKIDIRAKANHALSAAEKFSSGVSKPFDIIALTLSESYKGLTAKRKSGKK